MSTSKVSALDPEIIRTSFVYDEIKRSLDTDTPFELPPLSLRETERLRKLLRERINYCQFMGGTRGQSWERRIEGIVLATFEMDKQKVEKRSRHSDIAPGAASAEALRFLVNPGRVENERRSISCSPMEAPSGTGSPASAVTQSFKMKPATPPQSKALPSSCPKPITPFKRLIRKRSWASWWKALAWHNCLMLILKWLVVLFAIRYVLSQGLIQTMNAISNLVVFVFSFAFGILALLAEMYLVWWRGWQQRQVTVGGGENFRGLIDGYGYGYGIK